MTSRPSRLLGASWAAALVVPMLAVLVACTGDGFDESTRPPSARSTPSPTASFGDVNDFVSEYEGAAKHLTDSLPEGASFLANPADGWEADGRFEEGAGEVAAVLYWRCHWASAYIRSADLGRTADTVEALDRLAEWSELAEVRDHADSETRTKWLERVVEPARTGDDSMLRAITADCAGTQ